MNNLLKSVFLLLLIFIPILAIAQGVAQPVEMADALRSSGKIYVVVIVLSIIFIGIIIYLFSIDRKLTKLEKKISEKQNNQ